MKRFNIIAFLVFLGAVVWVFFLKPESVAALRSTFLGWFSPVIKASGTFQGEASPVDPRTKEELLAEVKRLEEEVFNLRFRQRSYAELERENARLRADLKFAENRHYDVTIPAQVVKRTRTSWWSTVTINRGRDHGVRKDLPVVDRDHGVVGKVTPGGLTADTAEVLLLTDEQCRVAARVGRNVSMRGIAMGYRGPGSLTSKVRLMFLDPDILLAAGAVLYTDDVGEGQVFPPGLVIGRVLEQVKGEYFDSAVIDPQVDFTRLDSVFVIRMAAGDQARNSSRKSAPVRSWPIGRRPAAGERGNPRVQCTPF